MNAAAAAAADFKSTFSPQFNGLIQPFGPSAAAAAAAVDEAALYAATGYAPPAYNSWASKVPSPLAGSAKSFPWGLNSVNMSGFNPVPPSGVSQMATAAATMGGGQTGAPPCMQHYGSPPNPYAPYRDQCGGGSTAPSTPSAQQAVSASCKFVIVIELYNNIIIFLNLFQLDLMILMTGLFLNPKNSPNLRLIIGVLMDSSGLPVL